MSLIVKRTVNLFLMLFAFLLQGQEMISGSVFSAKDTTALEGVAVYFDGTSLGTVTNSQGNFRIEKNKSGVAPLVISFLGFEKVILPLAEKSEDLPTIYLKEKEEMLAEVIVEPDTWSREKKLAFFRREFLGSTPAAADSKIINEDAIKLYYRPSKKVLFAEVSEPLSIINKHLGYKVTFDLSHFELRFLNDPGAFNSKRMVLYEGTSFFEELRERPGKKFLRNRELAYNGSSLHFMRSLEQRLLRENRFRIFHKGFETEPYHFFELSKTVQGTRVKLLAEKLSILYYDLEQSGLEATATFTIDRLGNHTPPMAVVLSGEMSQDRVANMLPLNYISPEEE